MSNRMNHNKNTLRKEYRASEETLITLIHRRFSRSASSNGSPHRPACSLPMPFEAMNRRATPLFMACESKKQTAFYKDASHPVGPVRFRQASSGPVLSLYYIEKGVKGRAVPSISFHPYYTLSGPSVMFPSRYFGMYRRAFPPLL